jgi:poly-gamma-glutamate synthesis protein (capsule biosynthesis protein)
LSDLKLPGLARIHSDCRPCLAAVMGFLGEGYQNFLNLNHKTSGDYAGAGSSPVTSYLTGYYTGEKVPEVRLLFTGDFMFDRHIRRVAANRGHDFILAPLKDLLLGYDLVVTNLEGPITPGPGHRPGAGAGGPYLFSFDPGVATLLRDHNLGLVHLGNNHSGDAGRRGLEQTLGYLRQARVAYFGDPEQDHQLLVREIAGIKMGFVSFNRFAPQGQERLWADLKMAREQCDLVVLYAHWGTEYAPRPGKNLRDLAHRFIDHGVDLIIGTHPHVIQEKEDYRGKMIYYSLGNFVFDQYFRQDTRRGLAVETRIHPVTLKLTCNDLYLSLERNGQTLLRKNEVPVEGTSQGEYIRPKNHAVR